jgi:Sigma-70 factor, region 1.2
VIGRAHATRRRRTTELDLFRLYLDEIGRHPLLTAEDEVELSRAYQAGLDAQAELADTDPQDPARPGLEAVAERGEWARRTMIEANLRLVVSIARRFSATGLPSATWSRRATWACYARSSCSTGVRASGSPPTPPPGSSRPLREAPPTGAPGQSVCPSISRSRSGGSAAPGAG